MGSSVPVVPVILVADDDPDILALVARRLERSGYAVVTATDGEEALELARSRRPDAAVLDVSMPKLDGYEVTRLLRADPATSATPVVLLTARAQAEDERCGYEAGADGYVRKPFTPQELKDGVAAALAYGGR